MKTNPIRTALGVALAVVVSSTALGGQSAPAAFPSPRQTGLTYGIGLGVSHVSLRALPGLRAVDGMDVALSWRVGYRTSSRVAVIVNGTSSPYRYTGPGRNRRRAFEGIFPSIEYRPSRYLWVSSGVGLNLDAPVFYDLRGNDASERRFARGFGAVLSAGLMPFASSAASPGFSSHVYVESRVQVGFNDVPEGRQHGRTAAVLVGVRR